ncbi:MAG: mannose-1-phosphate guanylyltransferase [Bacteroidales bacterium]|nr:mannose-1-phosphate guanylyltransferase [Bacteroidales bacterium]MBN2698550.1 mannose-1-phosphate guanylyltransferase [Bacteroidales bacterium]
MAGGIGSRFWPYSRTNRPKQFLDILGIGRTLIQLTVERFSTLIPMENIYIVSNMEYRDIIQEQVQGIPVENILLEPMRRNTAPCIEYANFRILQKNPDAKIVVAPSDHLIVKEAQFISCIKQGLEFVKKNDALLTLGILPNRPETGYGYIQAIQKKVEGFENVPLQKVKTFTEKPNLEMAKIFLESGDFYWNSGIFFWSLKTILESFKLFLPEIHSLFEEGMDCYGTSGEAKFIESTYSNCKNISVDYGLMEKAENVYVLISDFGWSDLGTWGSLYEQLEKDPYRNSITGKKVFLYDTTGSIIKVPDDRLVVLQGLNDYIVVQTEDILLVCKLEEEQKIRQIVDDIRTEIGEKMI